MAKKIILLKTGSTHPGIRQRFGDFEDWFLQAWTGCDVTLVNAVTAAELPTLVGDEGVVITGSPAMVTDREPWSEKLAAWLADSAHGQVPILGVCYGHQLLAHALGGSVYWHPQGREIGTVEIALEPSARQDPLLGILPVNFSAQVTHAQSVKTLPPGATLLARNAFEPHQAFRLGEATWGVQFHPEFSAEVMRAYIEETGADQTLLGQITSADANHNLLQRFVELI